MKIPAHVFRLLQQRALKTQKLGRARSLLWFSRIMEVRKDKKKIGHKCRLGWGHEKLSPSSALGLLSHRKQEPTKVGFGVWAAWWCKENWISAYRSGGKVRVQETGLKRKMEAYHLRNYHSRWWEPKSRTPRGWKRGVKLQRTFRKHF